MWDGIIKAEYLNEQGQLLPRFNGIIYKWMYVHECGMRTDAAASPIVVERNGRTFRWTPETKKGGIVTQDESLVPHPLQYRDMGIGRCRELVLA